MKGLFVEMDPAVEGSELLESGSTVDLQNEQSYLFGGVFLKSPSDAQVSVRKYEARSERKYKDVIEREKNIP